MVDLYKAVNNKILKIFIEDPSSRYSFSDLVRKTTSGPTNVKKAVDGFKEREILTSTKEGNRVIYRINLSNYVARSIFSLYAWDRVNIFPGKVSKGLQKLIGKLIVKGVYTVYLFGSATHKSNPNDIDIAVVHPNSREKLEKIWLETVHDFEEDIEVHFFREDDFIQLYKEGNFRITSTLKFCLILYDRNFIFDYIRTIPLPDKTFLLNEITKFEKKLRTCLLLYKENKSRSKELKEHIYEDFLRIYISSKKEIPGLKQKLVSNARSLGLAIRKRDLWRELEWMELVIKKIKINI
ncbi:hypothetical protein CL622_04865 [archaeon]|nr:hypothetical protein [archaeon]|tara:strand:- start:1532 stop:2416 length:885 start_codon:yes stop_codon:yes gene_type:complete